MLRSGDNLLISGQLWDRVRKKREELAKAGKNNHDMQSEALKNIAVL